ncbi:hypothetical protein GCM10028778_21930 [Barrientosiimonas marina]|uniref:Prenyltransferase n=1 Tax=Lentibacillus kimchii TaxID=1542911 RepID=A0ABW2URT8_9BACI
MPQNFLNKLRAGWTLIRLIAVVSSSVATIVSTMLPLFLYSQVPNEKLFFIFLILLFGGVFIHGVLTHVLNDHADYLSGTDQNSPAILSGGSRLIQNNMITVSRLSRLGKQLISATLFVIIMFVLAGFYKLAILLAIGLWSAWSYSLKPLQLSYKPFIGEWLAMFPAVLMLGLGGAWIALDTIPEWALQNAVINALFCSAWVMIHHIPDHKADRAASPAKVTSVVWAVDRFGLAFARLPALIYFAMIAVCAFWMGSDRLWGAIGVFVISVIAIGLVLKMRINDDKDVSTHEKMLLILAMTTSIWIGIFI